jgi:Tfp pilus assembly protein PilF
MKRLPLTLLVSLLPIGACRSAGPSGPYTAPSEASRSTVLAERLTRQAVDLAKEDPARAEALLREALTADLFYGPAHNNLGVLYLGQDRLYEAANEFEWARKLMPGHPDPRLNLALTLERAGQFDKAIDTYQTALEVAPEHVPSQQALSRLLLYSNRDDEKLKGMLETIALRGESPAWREWAKDQLLRLDG